MAVKKIRCSFCGKEEKDVRKLVFRKDTPNEGVCICDECTMKCMGMLMQEESAKAVADKEPTISASDMRPSRIKSFLDEHIIGQDRAKVAMSVAIYNHYKRIENIHLDADDDVQLTKGNILMMGPTGCGKTLIAQSIAKLLNVPFTVADATTLTEAGYVGEDVENIIKNLWIASGKNIERTSKGIVCIDEIDKIATRGDKGRDVGGEGVQQALLKMIESGSVTFTPDSAKNRPQQDLIQVDTTNILFIFSGAFNNIGSIVQNRIGVSGLGFHSDPVSKKNDNDMELRRQVETIDVIKYGLIPEFMGRIPVIVTLDELDENALLDIMWKPKNSILRQYERLFDIDHVKLTVTEDARRAIVKEAIRRKSGARGLRSIFEEVMLDVMYEVPSMENVQEVTIDEGVVLRQHDPALKFFKNAS
ncbi:MAG: ATP-dependent Clp protease ATP-binding subunit ClpX [Proteobacteria bacterium]|nr:ATP-dependent Clp protease ATP-binding subunit ClpX [Pseudomonadota bacterium]